MQKVKMGGVYDDEYDHDWKAIDSDVVSTVSSISSVPSIPSIQVSPAITTTNKNGMGTTESIPGEVHVQIGTNDGVKSDDEIGKEKEEQEQEKTGSASLDHERQVLLLFLLAQVCALHDPTPRTFTVHVLGLFEQGILDREAIHFLFELGFVPSSTVDSRGILATTERAGFTTTSADTTKRRGVVSADHKEQQIEVSITMNGTTTVEGATKLAIASPIHKKETLRSLEATAIRRKLSQHDNIHNGATRSNNKKNTKPSNGEIPSPDDINRSSSSSANKSWHVDHFPLSMSRYQREFKEISLINAGAFGQVYRVVRHLDGGYEYAVKKITFDAMGYSNESIQRIIREVQCLAAVNDHPNIVRYYTSWWEPTWMTGSIRGSESGRISGRRNNSTASRSSRKELRKEFLQIDAANPNVDSSTQNKRTWKTIQETARNVSEDLSSASSSSWSSYSDDDDYDFSGGKKIRRRRFSLDGGTGSIEEGSLESYHSHNLEPWTEVCDDSYMTKTAARRRRSSRQTRKLISTTHPYQYQISLYIQMELCHPATLQDWIMERNRRVPDYNYKERIGPALEIFQQICSGLAHIHKASVIHRDLKPANIFVCNEGKVIKIGDFGLSKQLHDIAKNCSASEHSSSSTPQEPSRQNYWHHSRTENKDYIIPSRCEDPSTQMLLEYNTGGLNPPLLTAGIGTASYAAPEQVQSKSYDTSVDIYSLGLIFLELVCCFETDHERLHNLQQCRYQRVPKWIDDNYPDIATTILACTRPKARERPKASDLAVSDKEVHILKGQLIEKEKEIAKKDAAIENMKLEIGRMKALLFPSIDIIEDVIAEDTIAFVDDTENVNS
mmetsp:Transcript_43411/g.48869  ORF Transcript_43411/g.48869 Transcript_43411/m.48869 type:complete len:840 (+) Transcript_43411:52-2571(+)